MIVPIDVSARHRGRVGLALQDHRQHQNRCRKRGKAQPVEGGSLAEFDDAGKVGVIFDEGQKTREQSNKHRDLAGIGNDIRQHQCRSSHQQRHQNAARKRAGDTCNHKTTLPNWPATVRCRGLVPTCCLRVTGACLIVAQFVPSFVLILKSLS